MWGSLRLAPIIASEHQITVISTNGICLLPFIIMYFRLHNHYDNISMDSLRPLSHTVRNVLDRSSLALTQSCRVSPACTTLSTCCCSGRFPSPTTSLPACMVCSTSAVHTHCAWMETSWRCFLRSWRRCRI